MENGNLQQKKDLITSVHIVNNILANHNNKIEFFINENDKLSGANSMFEHYYLVGNTKKTIIQSITLDEFTKQHGIEHITFLKADIEGSEKLLLDGAVELLSKQKIDYIQLEYNATWIKAAASLEDIFNYCQKYEYNLYRIVPKGLMKIDFYHYIMDDFIFQNLLMISNYITPPVEIFDNKIPRYITSDC